MDMNLKKYMQHHEAVIKEKLLSDENDQNWGVIKKKHEQIIGYMQHERLIHLFVTLAFGLFLLISTVIVTVKPSHQSIALMSLFFLMLIPYIAHYFFLENTIQRWYTLMDDIEKRMEHNAHR
jgi:hypothetical protein